MPKVLVVLAVSLLIAGSAQATLVIDAFDDNYVETIANGPAGSDSAFASCVSCVGGQRDLEILVSGGGGSDSLTFKADPAGGAGSGVLSHSQDAGIAGESWITWDGNDGGAATIDHTGLGGIDFTQGGLNTLIRLGIHFDDLGGTATVTAYTDASTFSQAVVALPSLTFIPTSIDVPFSSFVQGGASGPVDFTNVGAFSMHVTHPFSLDAQFDFISATHPVPEPSTYLMLGTGLLGLFGLHRRRRKGQTSS